MVQPESAYFCMPNSWLLKTEPSTFSWEDLVRDDRAVWDGVANAAALMHLRAMERGDEVLIYHSGEQKAIVGVARVVKGAYADPTKNDPKLVVVDIKPVRAVITPVTLAAIKSEPGLADFALVRISRLSCMPVSAAHRKILTRLGVA
jgi:predicted RNA-binding protein with PUA-like domain